MSCPFMAAAAPVPTAVSHNDSTKCPLHATHNEQEQQPAAVCPLGFGSARGPKLSSLHCPVCKGLLFDAQSVNCKHTFCHACISKTKHFGCPVCGQDVTSVEPNAEITGLVDTFLDTHSKSSELVAAQADLGPLPDNSPASFFMAQGLKSLAGGNVHAAVHRLGRCREALLQAAAAGQQPHSRPDAVGAAAARGSAGEAAASDSFGEYSSQPQGEDAPSVYESSMDVDSNSNSSSKQQKQNGASPESCVSGLASNTFSKTAACMSTACQLAAVCGSLGDCYQRLGDIAQAECLYQESISSVQPLAESDAEAAHAMSVSLNKLGDLRYTQQQLQDAKQLYKQALQLRQLYCGPLTKGEAGPEQQLELATSLIKVADVCKALQEHDEADQLLHRAQGVCVDAGHMSAALPAHVSRKLQMLLEILHAQGTAAASATAAAATGETDAAAQP